MRCDRIWTNSHLLTMAGRRLGVVENGLVASRDGRIVFAGPVAAAPLFEADETIDCGRRWITPGLIDCHTHLVFGGDRAHEFERRLEGATYEEIARAGGGILATMHATRSASEDQLVVAALRRLDSLIAEGVTTIEIKSGYGLALDAERRMLRAARRLSAERPISVVNTFLGAHALPPEFAADPESYISLVADVMIPQFADEGLIDAVDAFCENIGFSADQVCRVFDAAASRALPIKIHAEQLSNLHGAQLAASRGALSADHLEFLDDAGVAAMAAAGTVATLLPGAFYFVRETKLPPVEKLRTAHVPMAIATDCNPGTSPLTSLLLAMNMAATLFRLTVAECLAGTTSNAARALGIFDEVGSLEVGKRCDLAIWDITRPAELVYRIGFNPLHARIWSGL